MGVACTKSTWRGHEVIPGTLEKTWRRPLEGLTSHVEGYSQRRDDAYKVGERTVFSRRDPGISTTQLGSCLPKPSTYGTTLGELCRTTNGGYAYKVGGTKKPNSVFDLQVRGRQVRRDIDRRFVGPKTGVSTSSRGLDVQKYGFLGCRRGRQGANRCSAPYSSAVRPADTSVDTARSVSAKVARPSRRPKRSSVAVRATACSLAVALRFVGGNFLAASLTPTAGTGKLGPSTTPPTTTGRRPGG